MIFFAERSPAHEAGQTGAEDAASQQAIIRAVALVIEKYPAAHFWICREHGRRLQWLAGSGEMGEVGALDPERVRLGPVHVLCVAQGSQPGAGPILELLQNTPGVPNFS